MNKETEAHQGRSLIEYDDDLDYSMMDENDNITPNKNQQTKNNENRSDSIDRSSSPKRKNRKFEAERKDLYDGKSNNKDCFIQEIESENVNNNAKVSKNTRSRCKVTKDEFHKNVNDLVAIETKRRKGRQTTKDRMNKKSDDEINQTVTTPILGERSEDKTDGQIDETRQESKKGFEQERFDVPISNSCSSISNQTDNTDVVITFKNKNNQYKKDRFRSRSRSRSPKRRRRRRERSRSKSREERRRRRRRYSRDSWSSSKSSSMSSDEEDMRRRKKYRKSRERRERKEDLESDPRIQKLVMKMVKEQMSQIRQNEGGATSSTSGMNNTVVSGNEIVQTNDTETQVVNENENEHNANQISLANTSMKSPSEATMYVPAVRKQLPIEEWDIDSIKQKLEYFNNTSKDEVNFPHSDANEDNAHNVQRQSIPKSGKLSNFNVEQINKIISSIRLEAAKGFQKQNEETDRNEQTKAARTAAEQAILEAEKYKAMVEQPKGMCHLEPRNEEDYQLMLARYYDKDDDDFFHITCHVEPNLRARIERGEFVELEKLLQKLNQYKDQSEEGKKMTLINKNGSTYFVPQTDKDNKISNVRKWEQAFRTYAAIYCAKNPNRSVEVLQYIDVINRAAATYSWENVARYDYTFRQLMAAKPHRSWAKTYTQMWNLTLNEPVKRFNNNDNHAGYNGNNKSGKLDNTCWKFNKNKCPYSSKECRFEHRCSYCFGSGHGQYNCFKKNGKPNKQKGKSSGSQGQSGYQ